ncbi:MAG: TRAP transporter large permease [Candidatus Limivivens sp.]|nr:TRAP transporter large permease [Candidatus Limivivens sp.]
METTIAILVITFLVLLFLGMPIAFALGVPGLVYLIMQGGTVPISNLAHSMTTPLLSYVLIALPAFLLSGRMMNSGGVTTRLFDAALALVGRFRGGLAYANVLASMIFASMSGTAVGDTGGLGAIEMKMMGEAGYSKKFSAGITASSSVIGPLIPPSVAMVVLGSSAGLSTGRLFMGGLIPGVLMGLALMVSIYVQVHFSKHSENNWPTYVIPAKEIPIKLLKAVPSLFCPLIIIGGITTGIFTPTEAAVIAIDYAIILGIIYKELTIKTFLQALKDTVETSGEFMLIIAIAGFFTWIVTKVGLATILQNMLQPLYSYGPTIVVFVLGVILVIIGCFLDTTAAILLVTPILYPIVNSMGIDPIYFGVMMTVALISGIVTPPFGICLYVMSDVSGLPVSTVTKECSKYLPAMFIILVLIILFPQLSTWLPNLIYGV